MHYNLKQFTKRITINADKEIIYRSWATQAGLENWFLRLAEFSKPDRSLRNRNEFVQQGDKYKWLWFGYDDSLAEENEILFANGNDQLHFSFSGGCIVKISVKQEDGEMVCELNQTMPMDDEKAQRYFFIECGKGWTFYLANLKSILEGGLDLRNKNMNIANVVNA